METVFVAKPESFYSQLASLIVTPKSPKGDFGTVQTGKVAKQDRQHYAD